MPILAYFGVFDSVDIDGNEIDALMHRRSKGS
jgi:hypothetical protein